MPLKKRAQEASSEISEMLGLTLTADRSAEVTAIVERAIVDAVRLSAQRSSAAAVACCGPESDLAHKISAGIKREQDALFAKLSGYPGNR